MTVVGNAADAGKTAEPAGTDSPAENENMFDDVSKPSKATDVDRDGMTAEASKLPADASSMITDRVKINKEQYTPDELEITPEEKAAFIDALISGKRYTQRMSLFGGQVSVVIRSRTAAETHALYAYIRHMLAGGGEDGLGVVEGDIAYVPLVAQVAELNGTAFPEMKSPLTFTESGDNEVPPGWYEDFKAWKAKPEGLTSALISCVQLFEYKYWTMTREAANKNFWNSDTSTGE